MEHIQQDNPTAAQKIVQAVFGVFHHFELAHQMQQTQHAEDERVSDGDERVRAAQHDAVRQLLEQRWTPPGVHLPAKPLDQETVAAIIRITGGNFRLLNRLLTQMERILEINALQEVTKAVVEAARESLVIGEA